MSLLVARTEGKSEPPVPGDTGRWSPNTRPATSLRDLQVPPKPATACQVRPLHGLRRTVAKGRNFESSGRGHQETFRLIRVFALCKCAGWPVYETLGLETSLKLGFFSRAPRRPWCGRLHLRWAWKLWATKNPALWRSGPKTWRQRWCRRAVWLSSKWRLNQCGLRDYFY